MEKSVFTLFTHTHCMWLCSNGILKRRHSTPLVARATMTANGSSHSGVLRQFDARRADDARASAEVVRPNFRCVVEIANWCCRKDARGAGWLDGEGVHGRSTAIVGVVVAFARVRRGGGSRARSGRAVDATATGADLSIRAGDAEGDGCDIARAYAMRSSSMD